ncbi:MAG: class D sortase, partial [Bryobacteraceae bacterium]
FGCGILLLAYCGFALVDAWVFQRRASQDLDRQLRARRTAAQNRPPSRPYISPKAGSGAAPKADGLVGRIKIPRLLLSVVVVEGVTKTALRRAVGHIPGTALPGEAGNVGVAGHRDTFFRLLKDLRLKDEIQFSTLKGDFKYEVESLKVVEPNDVKVLAPSGENVLTMVTCYPFYFVGPAPQRWIVRARQVPPQVAPPTSME